MGVREPQVGRVQVKGLLRQGPSSRLPDVCTNACVCFFARACMDRRGKTENRSKGAERRRQQQGAKTERLFFSQVLNPPSLSPSPFLPYPLRLLASLSHSLSLPSPLLARET